MEMPADVSIHAPVKDATCLSVASPVGVCFNPRAREGRDSLVVSPYPSVSVSIHAPVKDATYDLAQAYNVTTFQSTRP